VDNLSFHLTKQSEVIRSRKEYRIAVGLDSNAATTSPVTGKLIVTCLRAEVSARAGRTRGTAVATTIESTAATTQSTSRVRKPEAGEGMQWIFYLRGVDNLSFHLTKQSEVIRSRKEYRIAVGLDSNAATTSPVTGKLIVTCLRAEVSARAGRTRGTAVATTIESTAATTQSTSRVRKPEAGEGMQWIFYLRGVPPP
ncbi:hypothetical protein AHF37_12284, partial [Paragonimus kellicotti]